MASKERLLILKMLQEGTISAEDALKLLEASAANPEPQVTSPAESIESTESPMGAEDGLDETPPTTEPLESSEPLNDLEAEVIARAKAKIAAAREKVAAVADQLAAADEKVADAGKSVSPLDDLADAVKALPGMRSVFDALSGLDPSRMASEAKRHAREVKRQTRRVARTVSDGLDEVLRSDVNRLLGVSDPTLTDAYEATLAVTPGMSLRVRNPFGDIVIQPTDNEQLRIAASINIWESDAALASGLLESLTVSAEVIDDAIVVGCTGPERSRKVGVDIVILMPRARVRMTLMSPTGKIQLEGVRATALVAATNSGDIRCSSVIADTITLETTSGDVNLHSIVGVVNVKSSSGDVKLTKTNGASVNLVSGSGDIHIDAVDASAVDLSSSSGDLYILKLSAQSLTMASVSGDIRSDLAGVSGQVKIDSATGWSDVTLHSSISPESLTMHSVSGDCSLKVIDKTGINAKVISRTGNVTLPEAFAQQVPGHYEGTTGDAPFCNVSIVTVSGDVAINVSEASEAQ
jgi:DUF4097 and DUF4098 domain-containing protein YvlB